MGLGLGSGSGLEEGARARDLSTQLIVLGEPLELTRVDEPHLVRVKIELGSG